MFVRNTEEFASSDVKTLEDPDAIDWKKADYKDIDRLREMIGYEKDELDPVVDDLVVRDLSGAIKDAQLLGGPEAMEKLPEALRERRNLLETVKEVWDNRDMTSTITWNPPKTADGAEIATREMYHEMLGLNEWFRKAWQGKNGAPVETGKGIIDRALSDGCDSLRNAVEQGKTPTTRNLTRFAILEGFKARYQTERDESSTSGNETETGSRLEHNVSTQEGFEKAIGIKDGEVDDIVAESAKAAWEKKLANAQSDENWERTKKDVRAELEFLKDDVNATSTLQFPESGIDKETLDRASEELRNMQTLFRDAWQDPSSELRYTAGKETIDELMKTTERRIETAQEALRNGHEVADVSRDSIAAAMLTLEHAATKYEARRDRPGTYGNTKRPGKEGSETGHSETENQREREAEKRATSGNEQAGDTSTSRGMRQEVFSSEEEGGPGSRDRWNNYHTEMYYGLKVRNKRAAEAFREGSMLSTDSWIKKARQETDVRAVAATLGDRTRWSSQEERQDRSEAAAYQMLARESFRQEERKAEKAYENWAPNRPENMTREQLWDVLNEDERDYFRGVFQQVAKHLEMAADPNVKWSNKDASKAIKSVMKAAEMFTMEQGITDKRGYMLRAPRPKAGGGEEERDGNAREGNRTADDSNASRNGNDNDRESSRNNRAESGDQNNNAETGGNENSEKKQTRGSQDRWDYTTVTQTLAEKDGPAGMEYLKRMIGDELTGGREPKGAQEVYADVLTEKYRDDLYESLTTEKDQAKFEQRLAELRGEALVLQGARSMREPAQVTADNADEWEPDGAFAQKLRETAAGSPEGDLKNMQLETLDRMEELARMHDGDAAALRQLSNYADAAQAMDVTLRTERDTNGWMTELLGNSSRESHPLLKETITRERFMKQVMGATEEDGDEMKTLTDVAWRAYGPLIEKARQEGASDVMIATIQDAGRNANYLRGLKLEDVPVENEQRVQTADAFLAMQREMDTMEKGLRDMMERGGSDTIEVGGQHGGLSPMGARLIQEQLHREIRAVMEPAESCGDFRVSDEAVQAKALAGKIQREQGKGAPA